MVKIKNIILYLLVYLLVTLELTLAVVMEIVEKICLTMHIIKNRLCKWMEDHLMNVYLVSYMERYILWIHICIYTHTIILNYEQLFGELITLTLGKNVNHTMYLCYVIYDN